MFCLKACDPTRPNARRYCEHIYDTQGCAFNAPSNARDGVFESCFSDSQPMPGVGPPIPPASSSCSTFASTDIYGPSATIRVPIPGASTITFSNYPLPVPTITPSASPSGGASATGTAATATATSGARALVPSSAMVFGAFFALAGISVLA
mgnify:CR=1 FL=1